MDSMIDTDLISMSVVFDKYVAAELSASVNLNISEYRIMALAATVPNGTTATMAKDVLNMKKSLYSQTVKSLSRKGLVNFVIDENGFKRCGHTERGIRCMVCADQAVARVHASFFGCVGEKNRQNLLSGSVVTSVFFDVARMREGEFLAEFANLDGCLRSELLYTEIAHSYELSLTELRILLYLLESDRPCLQQDVRDFLILRKPEMSIAGKSLMDKGHVSCSCVSLDKRHKTIELSPSGRSFSESLRSNLLSQANEFIRPAAEGEVGFYIEIAQETLSNIRKNARKR